MRTDGLAAPSGTGLMVWLTEDAADAILRLADLIHQQQRRAAMDRLCDRVVQFVCAHPGASGREVRRAIGGSQARVVAALALAEKHARLYRERTQRNIDRWYPLSVSIDDGPTTGPRTRGRAERSGGS
jgi:hypothetical protein